MENFKTFMDKHGETGVQALLDNWERYNGIKHDIAASLEHRWAVFMASTVVQPVAA